MVFSSNCHYVNCLPLHVPSLKWPDLYFFPHNPDHLTRASPNITTQATNKDLGLSNPPTRHSFDFYVQQNSFRHEVQVMWLQPPFFSMGAPQPP